MGFPVTANHESKNIDRVQIFATQKCTCLRRIYPSMTEKPVLQFTDNT